jgi:hypothetical protein
MSNSVHLSDMSRVPDQRCFRPFRNRQSAARSVLPNWQLPLTGRLVKILGLHSGDSAPLNRADAVAWKSQNSIACKTQSTLQLDGCGLSSGGEFLPIM